MPGAFSRAMRAALGGQAAWRLVFRVARCRFAVVDSTDRPARVGRRCTRESRGYGVRSASNEPNELDELDEHNAYIARRSSLAGFVVEGILGAIAFASAYVVALPGPLHVMPAEPKSRCLAAHEPPAFGALDGGQGIGDARRSRASASAETLSPHAPFVQSACRAHAVADPPA